MCPKPTLSPQDVREIEALRESMAHVLAEWTRDAPDVTTPIPNLKFHRREGPTRPDHCMVEPSVSLVIQGTKRALLGEHAYTYNIDRFLITSLDLPSMPPIVTGKQIGRAHV